MTHSCRAPTCGPSADPGWVLALLNPNMGSDPFPAFLIAFDRLCAQAACGVIDDDRLRLSYGEGALIADRLLMLRALRTLLTDVAARATKWVELDVAQTRPDMLCITLRDDREDKDDGHPDAALSRLDQLLSRNGGGRNVNCTERWHETQVTLPGRMVLAPETSGATCNTDHAA